MSTNVNKEIILKYVIVGDSGCGKSSLINQYMTNEFDENVPTTIGVEFYVKRFKLNNIDYRLHIWDLAGQERFKAIARSYYRNCDGVLMMFDLTNHKSFNSLKYWYNEMLNMYDLENVDKYNPSILVIGNKNDIPYRDIDNDEIEDFLEGKNIVNYMECSAKTGENVLDIFDMLNKVVDDRITKYNPNKIENTINLTSQPLPPLKEQTSYCCYF